MVCEIAGPSDFDPGYAFEVSRVEDLLQLDMVFY